MTTPKMASLTNRVCLVNSQPLEEILDYHFDDPSLLKQALTHSSYGAPNNERLEFVGDSILNYVIARILYEQFSSLTEGDLTLLRTKLVNQSTLSDIAKSIGLGNHLFLGEGEKKSGGADRSSILADGLEALFAAICFDGGFVESEVVIQNLFLDRVNQIEFPLQTKDAKTVLQETLQSQRLPLPNYTIVNQATKANGSWFDVTCTIDKLLLCAKGSGSSKKNAEQQAAAAMLAKFK